MLLITMASINYNKNIWPYPFKILNIRSSNSYYSLLCFLSLLISPSQISSSHPKFYSICQSKKKNQHFRKKNSTLFNSSPHTLHTAFPLIFPVHPVTLPLSIPFPIDPFLLILFQFPF